LDLGSREGKRIAEAAAQHLADLSQPNALTDVLDFLDGFAVVDSVRSAPVEGGGGYFNTIAVRDTDDIAANSLVSL
jgi:hypothetical protein